MGHASTHESNARSDYYAYKLSDPPMVPDSLKAAMVKLGVSRKADIRLLQFNSTDQQPQSRIGKRGAVGHPSSADHLITESSRIKDLLCAELGYGTPRGEDMWQGEEGRWEERASRQLERRVGWRDGE